LVVEEALSKKDLSSGGADFNYADMKAAGLQVWKKMLKESSSKLIKQPPVANVHASAADAPVVQR